MLNVRSLSRFCKHPSQYTKIQTSIFFSSGSDDGNNKPPSGDEGSDADALESALNASFKSKNIIEKVKKIDSEQQQLMDKKPKAKTEVSFQPLEHLLSVAHLKYKIAKPGSEKVESLPIESRDELSSQISKPEDESNRVGKQRINLAINKQAHKLSPKELLNRVKKIAQEVARGPGNEENNKIAEELVRKLQFPKEDEKFDLRDFTYQTHQQKDGSDQSVDLLRSRIISEEHIYNPSTAPWERPKQYKQQDHTPRWSRPSISADLEISLYPKSTLGIFTNENKEEQRTDTFLHTFHRLEQRNTRLSQNYAPRNWFEQCIQWTEQGKLWHFPINNEQGLEEEAATVSFTEHIFLEDHLEGWCPTAGPVRHFMELVCIGLSKNPYLSVEEKIDNIMWYRDYLNQHTHILEASGALGSTDTKVPNLEAQ